MAYFTAWDYVVFIVMLVISASIGIYYRFTGGKQKTTNEYFLANKSSSVWMVAISLMASFMSSITLLGVSMENYQFGTMFVVVNLAYGLVTPIAVYLFLPVFFKLQATSAYAYLERRFGKSTRLAASVSYSLQMILYMGVVLYAPALALEALTGMNKAVAIFSIGIVCTFYSTIGGMKAVIVTDVFQSLLMYAAVISVIVCAGIKAGGLGPIWQTALDGGRIDFLNFDLNPTTRHTWWSLIIGGGMTHLTVMAVNQTQVQRLLTVKNLKSSQTALWLSWPALSFLSLSTSFSGLAIYYLYSKCDPLLQGRISNRDQIMPLFVVDAMGDLPGLPGLFASGIFSASLSSISAALNSLAAVTLEDYIKPLYRKIKKKPLPEINTTLPSKILALLYGIVCIGMAFIAQYLGGVLQASLTIFGVVGGPLFALFSLGMFVPKANQRGSLCGLAMGLIFAMYLGFGQPKPDPPTLSFSLEDCSDFQRTGLSWSNETIRIDMEDKQSEVDDRDYVWLLKLSYMWYGVLGYLTCFIFGWLISILLDAFKMGGEKKIYLDKNEMYIDADLFAPPLARYFSRKNAKRLESDSNFESVDEMKKSNFERKQKNSILTEK